MASLALLAAGVPGSIADHLDPDPLPPDQEDCAEFAFFYRDGSSDIGTFCDGNDARRGDEDLTLEDPPLNALELHLSCSDTFHEDGTAEKSDLDGHLVERYKIRTDSGKICGDTFADPTGSITVCKVIVNETGAIVDGSSHPGTNFTISDREAPTGFTAAGDLPNSSFETPLTFTDDILFDDGTEDAECVTHDELPLPSQATQFGPFGFGTDDKDPVAEFSYTCSGLTCTFNGTPSVDLDGNITTYEWDFHDDRKVTGPAVITHTFSKADDFDVELKVTDDDGNDDKTKHKIRLKTDDGNKKPTPAFTFDCNPERECTFDGSISQDIDGSIVHYEWDLDDGTTITSTPTFNHTFAENKKYKVELEVTDNQGEKEKIDHEVDLEIEGAFPGSGECYQFRFIYRSGLEDAGFWCGGGNEAHRGDDGLFLTSGDDLNALELHLSCSDTFHEDGTAEKSDLDGQLVDRYIIEKPDGKTCGTADLEDRRGDYFYDEETVDPEGLLCAPPRYNDQFETPIEDLDDFFPYSDELFDDDPSNDSARNTDADGHIVLTDERPHRTLVVLNCLEEVPTQEEPTLEVLKTPDGGEVDAESQFSWTVEIINSGDVDAENVTLNDTIPQGLIPFGTNPSQGSCQVDDRNVSCELGTIPAGDNATVAITVLVTGEECGRIDNLAIVQAEGPTGNQTRVQDTGHVHVVCADASVEKTARDASVPLGDDVVFDVNVTAHGPNASENVTLEDQLPPISGGWTLSGTDQGSCAIDSSDRLACDFGTIEPSQTRSITVTGGTGDASDCGVVRNTAMIDSDLDLDNTNDTSQASMTVACADASVEKTARDASVPLGDDVVFDVNVTAHGPNASENVTLEDQLPPISGGWTLSGTDQGSCAISGLDVLTCDFGTIEPNQTRSITVTGATGTDDDCGVTRNTVTIDSDVDQNTNNDTGQASTTVVCEDGEPEISIEKGPDRGFASAGDTFNWTITVTNHGPGTARDVNVTDIVDANLTIVSVTPPCTFQQQLVTCDLGDLSENETVSIEIQVLTHSDEADDCRRFQNTAAVEASNEVDPDALSNTDRGHLTVGCPDITVEKTPDGGTAAPGGNVTWTNQITNNGPGTATGVTLNDTIDTEIVDMEFVSSSPVTIPVSCTEDVPRGQFNCTVGDIPDGETVEIVHNVTLASEPCDVVTNVANVSASNELDANRTDNTDTGHVTCEDGDPDPRIEKTPANATVAAGQNHTWNVTVKNLGNGTAFDVQITDIVDDGLNITEVSPTPECSVSGQVVTCQVGSLAPNETFTAQITVETDIKDCENSPFKNTATVTFAESASALSFQSRTDFAFLNVECVPTEEEPALEILKTPDGGDVHIGDPFNWTLQVINSGSVDAENVTVNDTIPAGLEILDVFPGSPTCEVAGQDVGCDLGTLPAGDDAFVNITVQADGDVCGTILNTATVDADGTPTGTLSDTGHVNVLCPDAKVTKTATDSMVTPPTQAAYTITVENLGPGNATNVTLTDPLPGTGWTLSGANASACEPFDGSSLDCNFGTLEPGETRTVTVSRPTSDPADCDDLRNTATVATPGDTNSRNDQDTATITVDCVPTQEEPTLEILKTPDGGTVAVDEVFDWTLQVINSGSVDAENVTLDDDVPGGLDVLSVDPSSPTCTIAGNSVHCDLGTLSAGQDTFVNITVRANGQACGRIVNTGTVDADGAPQGTLSDTGHVDVDCPEEERYMMAHRPFQDPEGELGPYLKERGIYVDRFNATALNERLGLENGFPDEANASVRIYGEVNRTAPAVYADASQAFDPTVIPKDSITFNPALIRHTDPDAGTIRGCDGDADLKKHLRMWYEPSHAYDGPRVEAGEYDATLADVVQVESTYQLVDSSSEQPTTACPDDAQFPFPTAGVHLDLGDGHQQPGLDTMTNVNVSDVSPGTSTQGTVELERDVTLAMGESIQFLDHGLTFKKIVTDLEGDKHAQVTLSYLGNTFETSKTQIDLRERVYATRSNALFATPQHGTADDVRTWYAQLVSFDEADDTATIQIGKELAAGDTFYVDGVRYDVPAVQTVDGELAYLTLRTPLPKSDPQGSWASTEDPTREEELDPAVPEGTGTWQVQDNSVVTTQWLVEIDWTNPIPVDPPFNRESYRMVDDTDVQLWEPTQNTAAFPYGPPEGPLPGGDGQPMFPAGERYLTMEDPPQAWITFFDAERTGYEDSLSDRFAEDVVGINHDAWEPGLEGPPAFNTSNTNLFWIQEWFEDRLSKNLLELPDGEAFTFDDRATLPDRHTSFVLPDRPNPVSSVQAQLAFATPCSRMDVVPGGSDCQRTADLLGGDYLVMTSLRLQDATTRHAFAHVPEMGPDQLDRFDLYFNEVNLTELFGGERPNVADTTVRLYGEEGEGNHAPDVYTNASAPFDPMAIAKDSATFNPAIVRHTDPDAGTITACGEDANLKKRLRVFYEPGHAYGGPRIDGTAATVADTIQVESTYELLDGSSYRRVTGCAAGEGGLTQFPFPTEGAHLAADDGHEQPGLDTARTVRVGDVSPGTSPTGTVELERKVTLEMGEAVQFLDHRAELDGTVQVPPTDATHAQVEISYVGNALGLADQADTHNVRDRIYLTRSNSASAAPLHDAGSATATWYIELDSFDASSETATLIVGKELQAGDVFYADGVRYEVPSVVTVDGELSSLTLRTPIPKSDPGGSWTSVTEPTREDEIDGQWQVEDGSHVTSQWLVQVDNKDPIPVDPPFNQESYTMVDDIDVQLWEPTKNTGHFPWGPANASLPDGNGLPLFPQGERYLTVADPPEDWKSFFGAVPTGNLDEGTSYADDLENRLATADGINHDAWSHTTLESPPAIEDGNTTVYWLEEWYEGRYSTNLLEIREDATWAKDEINTRPDRYTTFVLPDRPNPASSLTGTIEIGDDPACTRGDLVDLATCERTVPLLGGDYAIVTSLVEEDDTPNDTGDQTGGQADVHPYDADQDCVISDTELLTLVAAWGADEVDDTTLLSGVAAWGQAPEGYC